MESMAEYLERKTQEILFWQAYLQREIELPPLCSVADVVHAKYKLRAAQLAETASAHWQLTESNWTGESACRFYDYRLEYGYQRFDLSIHGPPIYRCLRGEFAPSDFASGFGYANSGMGAIAGMLLALQEAGPGTAVCMLQDSYFETQCALRHFTPRLELVLVENGGSFEVVRTLRENRNRIAVLLDSVSQRDPTLQLDVLRNAPPDLLLFDTTCYESSDPRITQVVRFAITNRVPLVLLRSHVKLDSFGIEYARLGSTVCIRPRSLGEPGVEFFRALLGAYRSAISCFGLRATPFNLLPFWGDERFHVLNQKRLQRIEENNRTLASWLTGGAERVLEYQHHKYITVEPVVARDRAGILALVDVFGKIARKAGVCAWRADSFGFDFIALTDFVDLARDRHVFRIAASDAPDAALQNFFDLWAEFLRTQLA